MSLLNPRRLAGPRRFSPLSMFEALATPHGVDRYLELVNPMLTVRELRAEVIAVERPTNDSVRLTLRPTRQWQGFQAGQFVSVSVDINGVRRTRCYSPASSQRRSDGLFELTVKAHPHGLVSQYLHAQARPGMVVGLSQADGTFRLPSPRPDKILLISGGSGITPVMSMLRTLCDEGYRGEIVFLHYAFGPQHVAYLDELQQLAAAHPNVRLALAYTQERSGGDLHGLFQESHLADVAAWYADAHTYLCGPPGLMTAVRAHFEGRDLAERLYTEDFAPAPVAPLNGDVTGATRFGSLATENAGETLLEQAEAAGLSPEHGCRMGICFSCTQVKTSGCVQNIRTGEINSDPDVEVQLCISRAVGDVAINL
ncbi:ferredoxin reductase [uncultured Jatrophihabitans sp.]|uniref:ferredoxin reductase n=1 Tax=uncultured Jatrophihabitans sp. TaxID=1610747 RepID=UPI0035CBB433